MAKFILNNQKTHSDYLIENKVNLDRVILNYKLIGEGPPLLILHGWASSSDAWVETQERLSQQGYTVWVPDLPGFGQSDPPPVAWGVNDYARLIENFARQLNIEKFFLLGHSFGGRIGIRIATLWPDRVRGLILCASAGIKPKRTLKHIIFLALAKMGKSLLSWPLLNYLHSFARKVLYFLAREQDYYRAQGVMKETMGMIIEEDLRPDLGKIVAPTLIVWGSKDQLTPLSDAFIMQKEIPQASLEIVKEAGHRLPYEVPKIFTDLVSKFLKDLN